MSFKNTDNHYGSIAKAFHWITFLLIAGLVAAGFYMSSLPKGPDKWAIYDIHKTVGLIALMIILARLSWRQLNTTPALPNTLSSAEKNLSRLGHFALYLMALVMPLSGWIMSTAANKLPHIGSWAIKFPLIPQSKNIAGFHHSIHVYGVWLLIGLVVLHVLAALRHHFILKDTVLKRMLPSCNR